jgi:hypothetical protein
MFWELAVFLSSGDKNVGGSIYSVGYSLTHSVALQPWRAQAAVNTVS